jgi:transposase InsO family protein
MRRGQTTSAEQVVLKLRQIAVQTAQGKDRVQRIWRREGLKVPQKHRPATALLRGECETGDGLRGRSMQRDFLLRKAVLSLNTKPMSQTIKQPLGATAL